MCQVWGQKATFNILVMVQRLKELKKRSLKACIRLHPIFIKFLFFHQMIALQKQ